MYGSLVIPWIYNTGIIIGYRLLTSAESDSIYLSTDSRLPRLLSHHACRPTQENTSCWPSVDLMLGQRHRWWVNIKSTHCVPQVSCVYHGDADWPYLLTACMHCLRVWPLTSTNWPCRVIHSYWVSNQVICGVIYLTQRGNLESEAHECHGTATARCSDSLRLRVRVRLSDSLTLRRLTQSVTGQTTLTDSDSHYPLGLVTLTLWLCLRHVTVRLGNQHAQSHWHSLTQTDLLTQVHCLSQWQFSLTDLEIWMNYNYYGYIII